MHIIAHIVALQVASLLIVSFCVAIYVFGFYVVY